MNNSIEETKPSIWFIHGANASPLSFINIQTRFRESDAFKGFEFVNVTYDCQNPLAMTIETIADSLPSNRPVYLIGHSLGGVIAVAVSQRVKHFEMNKQIKAVITLASPLGGCEGADYLQWIFPHYHLFKNISTKNRVITDIKAAGAVVPTLCFITTSGNNPIYPESNDGVVTVNSQRSLKNSKKIEAPFNHFEVLLSNDVVDKMKIAIMNPSDIFGKEFKVITVED
jgi:triacylglycerol esterase/lipase EstA (alpha/beta hydrolase family)